MIISTTIREHIKPTSSNELYMAVSRKRGVGAFLTKRPEYRKFEEDMRVVLEQRISKDEIVALQEELKNDYKLSLELVIRIGMSETDFYRSDISNAIKSTEDCLKSHIGVDDTRNTVVIAQKYILAEAESIDDWKLDITISTVENDYILEDKWSKKIK